MELLEFLSTYVQWAQGHPARWFFFLVVPVLLGIGTLASRHQTRHQQRTQR